MKNSTRYRRLDRGRFEALEDRRLLAAVAARNIFYNQSAFDGNNAVINAADDAAIATDKTAYFAIDQLTTNAVFDSQPWVWGDQIVWQGRGGTDGGTDDEIFWYDGTTVTQLTANTTPDQFPKLSDLGIAWERGTGATKKIVFHDTVTETVLTSMPLGSFSNVFTLTDDRLTWEDQAEADFEIVTWNNTGDPTKLSNNTFTDRFAEGDGNNVVWVEIEGSTRRVRYFDGSTTTTVGTSERSIEDPDSSGTLVAWEGFKGGATGDREIYTNASVDPLTNNSYPDFDPQVSGQNIVWWGNNAGVSQVYLYNGSTIQQLSTGTINQFPKIDGNNVVWQGSDGSDFEIFFYDGQTVTQLTNNDIDDTNPQISGNHVVWQGAIPFNGNSSEIFHTHVVDKAQFNNITSFTRGITGIMVDLVGSGSHAAITAADFVFKVGNDNTPASWAAAPAPTSVVVRGGDGVGGSDRVEITWAENSIRNMWLEVQVLATANTGLLTRDLHYWGNKVGDTGNPSPANFSTTVAGDGGEIVAHLGGSAGITSIHDINRTNSVTLAGDRGDVVANLGTITRLKLGTTALPGGGGGIAEGANLPAGRGTAAGDAGIASALASGFASSNNSSSSSSQAVPAANLRTGSAEQPIPVDRVARNAAIDAALASSVDDEDDDGDSDLGELFVSLAAAVQ